MLRSSSMVMFVLINDEHAPSLAAGPHTLEPDAVLCCPASGLKGSPLQQQMLWLLFGDVALLPSCICLCISECHMQTLHAQSCTNQLVCDAAFAFLGARPRPCPCAQPRPRPCLRPCSGANRKYNHSRCRCSESCSMCIRYTMLPFGSWLASPSHRQLWGYMHVQSP